MKSKINYNTMANRMSDARRNNRPNEPETFAEIENVANTFLDTRHLHTFRVEDANGNSAIFFSTAAMLGKLSNCIEIFIHRNFLVCTTVFTIVLLSVINCLWSNESKV